MINVWNTRYGIVGFMVSVLFFSYDDGTCLCRVKLKVFKNDKCGMDTNQCVWNLFENIP